MLDKRSYFSSITKISTKSLTLASDISPLETNRIRTMNGVHKRKVTKIKVLYNDSCLQPNEVDANLTLKNDELNLDQIPMKIDCLIAFKCYNT